MKRQMDRIQLYWRATGTYFAALATLAVIGTAGAIMSPGGFAVETSGMKISLQLSASEGTKLVFQRADKT